MLRANSLMLKALLLGAVAVGPVALSGCGDSVPEGSTAKTDAVEKAKVEDGMKNFMQSKAKGGGAPK